MSLHKLEASICCAPAVGVEEVATLEEVLHSITKFDNVMMEEFEGASSYRTRPYEAHIIASFHDVLKSIEAAMVTINQKLTARLIIPVFD